MYRDNLVDGRVPLNPRSRFYSCVDNADELKMKFSLYRKGKELLRRGPEFHWWLTGFKWGVFTGTTSDLSMHIEIDFPTTEMCDAFKEAAKRNRYHTREKGRLGVAFTFQHPHTQQPAPRKALEGGVQARNYHLVGGYDLLKKTLKISSNDPNAFALPELDAPAREAVHRLSGAAKKVRHVASPAARRLRNKVSDEAGTAYHEVFTFFDNKLWHVTHHPRSGASSKSPAQENQFARIPQR